MATGEVNPLNQWPKVRHVEQGVLVIRGRYISSGQWITVRVLAFILVLVLMLNILAAAAAPWLMNIADYLGPGRGWVLALWDFRMWLRWLLTEQYPDAGRVIYYTGMNKFDWHLAAIWALLRWLRKPIRAAAASGLAAVLGLVLARRFKVTITRDRVTIHRGFRKVKLSRMASEPVKFQKGDSRYQRGIVRLLLRWGRAQPSMDNEFVMVMATGDFRPVAIAAPRKRIKADRIIKSLQQAMRYHLE